MRRLGTEGDTSGQVPRGDDSEGEGRSHGPPFRSSWHPVIVDLDLPIPDVFSDGSTHLHVTARWQGRPLGSIVVRTPLDPFPGWLLADVLRDRFAGRVFEAEMRARLLPATSTPAPTATVVVCTRDRPAELARCLDSIRRLAGGVEEIIVVDNGSRTPETKAVAEASEATYVWEPLPGLDRARNRGLAEASGDIVLYTDDDVEVDPGWTRGLLACFDDPLVMAATGLVLPARLDTPARRASELYGSHGRGSDRRVLDGTVRSPTAAGNAGVGASMAFRAGFLHDIGGFPEELDAGMPTGTGGDTYTFYRVLRAGYRLVYEPAAIAHHTHRASGEALRQAFRANGTGVFSWLWHAAWRDGDPGALTEGARVVRYLAERLVRAGLRRPGAPSLNLALTEAAGALRVVSAYPAARRRVRARDPVVLTPRHPVPWLLGRGEGTAEADGDLPSLSVVIPSRARGASLVRLLQALDDQKYLDELLEVVVVLDGDVDGSEAAVRAAPLRRPPRLVVLEGERGRPSGAAAARNAGAAAAQGELLLFLDDNVVPMGPGVLAAHALAQRPEGALVVGPCSVDLRGAPRLFAQRVRNWWVDHTRRLLTAEELDFADVCTGNVSVPARILRELGGFHALRRREDWEFGYRAARAGVPIRSAAGAAVLQIPELDFATTLEDHRGEGAGDFAFARSHPEMLWRLPLAAWDGMRRSRRLVRLLLGGSDRVVPLARAGVPILSLFEHLGLRRASGRLMDLLNFASYWAGVSDAAGDEGSWLDLLDLARWSASPPLRTEMAELARNLSPDLSCAAVEIVHAGRPLGEAPLWWGGVPFERHRFVEAVLQELGHAALRAEVLG